MAKLFSQRNKKPYIQQVDELAKLRRPSQTMFAEETGSSIPFAVSGMRQRSGMDVAKEASSPGMPAPEQVDLDVQLEDLPGYQFPGQSSQGSQDMAGSFVNWLNSQFIPQGMATAPDGGMVLSDGTVVYKGGGIKNQAGEVVYPMASVPGGKLLYSDGQIRSGGLNELIKTIFGQERSITQAYGNVNPGMGYGNDTHQGVDIRTRDLQGFARELKLPFNTRVVQVLGDDGNPYGNSILLELPTGEMLRFSHLSNQIGFKPGDTLPAWTSFGTPGSTGNSTGEHLDLEYYNAQGQIDNPENFRPPQELMVPISQLAQPESQEVRSEMPRQETQGEILGATNQQFQQPRQIEPPQPKPDRPMNFDFTKVQPNPEGRPAITAANAVDVMNPTGRFDLGITEGLRGDAAGAREKQAGTIENVGTFLKAPELNTGELAREQGTSPFRQLAGNLADKLSQTLKSVGIDVGERGISERIAGGATTFTNAFQPKQAYAQEEIPQSGQGLQELAGMSSAQQASARPDISEFNQRKAIGDVGAPGNVLGMTSTADMQAARAPGDIRDPFFKMGLDKTYGSYMDADKAKTGALTLDLFKPDFYKNMGNVEGAFKGTSLFSPAQGKYTTELENFKNQFKSMYGSGYDQGDVERILSSIPSGADINSLNLPAPKLVPQILRSSSGSSGSSKSSSSSQLFPGSSYSSSAGSQPVSQASISKLSSLASKVPANSPPPPASKYQLAPSPVSASSATVKSGTQSSGNLFSNLFSSIMNLFKR